MVLRKGEREKRWRRSEGQLEFERKRDGSENEVVVEREEELTRTWNRPSRWRRKRSSFERRAW